MNGRKNHRRKCRRENFTWIFSFAHFSTLKCHMGCSLTAFLQIQTNHPTRWIHAVTITNKKKFICWNRSSHTIEVNRNFHKIEVNRNFHKIEVNRNFHLVNFSHVKSISAKVASEANNLVTLLPKMATKMLYVPLISGVLVLLIFLLYVVYVRNKQLTQKLEKYLGIENAKKWLGLHPYAAKVSVVSITVEGQTKNEVLNKLSKHYDIENSSRSETRLKGVQVITKYILEKKFAWMGSKAFTKYFEYNREAENFFESIYIEQKRKWKNVTGTLKQSQERLKGYSLNMSMDGTSSLGYMVVTVIYVLSATGDALHADGKNALKAIEQISSCRKDELLAAEVMWQPLNQDTILTRQDVEDLMF